MENKALIPALKITPTKAPIVGGNFDEIKQYMISRRKEIEKLKVTEHNMPQILAIKKEVVAYRTAFTKLWSEIKELYFNGPKAVNEARAKEVLGEIAALEAIPDKILQKKEEERVANLNMAYDAYKETFQEKYKLSEAFLTQVVLKPSYYNKTPEDNEKKSKDDMEKQFVTLKAAQDAEEAGKRLIREACAGDERLNAEHWIGQTKYMDAAQVLEAVAEEKKRLAGITEAPKEEGGAIDADYDVVAEGDTPTLVIGTAEGIDFSSDFKGRMKTKRIELKYPVDLADAISELFKRLKVHGIKIRELERETVF
jgi:hypothetical protein